MVLSLWFLRLLNVLGSGADILIRWVSAIGLILCGVFVGLFISQKQIRVRPMLVVQLLLFTLGFLATPLVGIGVLMLVENLRFDIPALLGVSVGVSVTVYLLLYMGLVFWLKKKGTLRLRQAC
jgi:hypothetical protein